jgi:Na+-transporting methylmalonyl-CoA/oxaloacetate decarboxylase gamma subunit
VENLGFGLRITAVGMGLVFALLGLLWLVLTLLGVLDRPEPAVAASGTDEPAPEPVPLAISGPGAEALDADALAAVAIAVATHVGARRRQAAPEMRSSQPGSRLHASRWVGTGRSKQTREWTPRR